MMLDSPYLYCRQKTETDCWKIDQSCCTSQNYVHEAREMKDLFFVKHLKGEKGAGYDGDSFGKQSK